MRELLITLLICLVASASATFGQEHPPASGAPQDNPLSAHNRMVYEYVKRNLLGSAEKMPEEDYSFKPTDAVRSYGQILGHVADAQYAVCSIVLGEQNPAPSIEKSKTTKAELVAAIKDSCTYCDKAYAGMTDVSGVEMVTLLGHKMPKLGALNMNNIHAMEHYGNLVTYMRMKNIVPPSSDRGSR
ncbi:MAG TPA: DinB family protein [Acidobacteriota bacterium]|nr:DinB family protein [Acidobacteriota bacterium]